MPLDDRGHLDDLAGCPVSTRCAEPEVLPSETSEVVTHVGMNGILIAPAEAEGESTAR